MEYHLGIIENFLWNIFKNEFNLIFYKEEIDSLINILKWERIFNQMGYEDIFKTIIACYILVAHENNKHEFSKTYIMLRLLEIFDEKYVYTEFFNHMKEIKFGEMIIWQKIINIFFK